MIYLIDTTPWTEDEVQKQCENNNIEYADGFYFQQTCVKLASLLVKKHIASQHRIPFSALQVSPRGKPYFPNVQFNLTHHDRLVVAVDSTTGEVGIDLTDQETPFTPGQQKELWKIIKPGNESIPSGLLWAAREAYLKYTGDGSRNGPVNLRLPSHQALPDLQNWQWSVMPIMRVEGSLVRCFRVQKYVGAVIASPGDLLEVTEFSSELI